MLLKSYANYFNTFLELYNRECHIPRTLFFYFICATDYLQMFLLFSFPATGLERPLGLQKAEAPEFLNNQHMKVVRLSALCTGCLYPQEGFLVLISVKRLSRPQGHNATERIKSLKNSSDSTGNRTRDLLACSAVPQPTALLRTPSCYLIISKSQLCS
jgi:hypothetical protein